MKYTFLTLFTFLSFSLLGQDFQSISIPETDLFKDSLTQDSSLFFMDSVGLNLDSQKESKTLQVQNTNHADIQQDNWTFFSSSVNHDTSTLVEEYIPSPILPLYDEAGMRINPFKKIPDSLSVNLNARKSLLREDTTAYDAVDMESIIIISEELAIDCVWVTLKEYYAVWDSRTVNPYKIDASQFKDTINIALFDTLKEQSWAFPLGGDSSKVNSKFGMRGWRWHYGTDLDLETGDPVYAAFDGIVRISRYGRGFGNFVVLRHYNGFETVYGHLSKREVESGFYVKAGQRLGLGGSTGRSSGPHLHFELRYQGNPINPNSVYDFAKNTLKSQNFELNPTHFKHFKQINPENKEEMNPDGTPKKTEPNNDVPAWAKQLMEKVDGFEKSRTTQSKLEQATAVLKASKTIPEKLQKSWFVVFQIQFFEHFQPPFQLKPPAH